MSNKNNTDWDLTIACLGEVMGYDENAMMEELYSDPEFLADMEARKNEALEYQMAHDAIEHQE